MSETSEIPQPTLMPLIPPEADLNNQENASLIAEITTLRNILAQKNEQIAGLEKLVTTDPLTGLLNRKAYNRKLDELQQIKNRQNNPNFTPRNNELPLNVVVFSIDADGLKKTNDELGHTAGDALIEAIGEGLKKCFRSDDDLFHPHGDEFFVITGNIPQTDTDEFIAIISDRLLSSNLSLETLLNSKYPEGLPVKYLNLNPTLLNQVPQFSFGFSAINNQTDIHTAERNADSKMYDHKNMKKAEKEAEKALEVATNSPKPSIIL